MFLHMGTFSELWWLLATWQASGIVSPVLWVRAGGFISNSSERPEQVTDAVQLGTQSEKDITADVGRIQLQLESTDTNTGHCDLW